MTVYDDKHDSPSEQSNQVSEGKHKHQQVQQMPAEQKCGGQTKTEKHPYEGENDSPSQQDNQVSGGRNELQQVRQTCKRRSQTNMVEIEQFTEKLQKSEHKCVYVWQGIQSFERKQQDGDGNLLEAVTHDNTDDNSTVELNFRGTDSKKPESVFYAQNKVRHDVFNLHCKLGKDNYYLCAVKEKVHLQKQLPNHNYHEDNKFLFHVTPVDGKIRTIKSLETGMYLACGDCGSVVMKKDDKSQKNGKDQDRIAWFSFEKECVLDVRKQETCVQVVQLEEAIETTSNE